MKKFIYTIILTLTTFALVGCAADAPQSKSGVPSGYVSNNVDAVDEPEVHQTDSEATGAMYEENSA